MKTEKPTLDPEVRARRTFLRTLGFTGGAAFLGSSLSKKAMARDSKATGRRPMALLNPSGKHSPDGEFVRTCEALMSAQSRTGGERGLEHVLARLCSPLQAYLTDVRDADSWLERNGFLKSLDYYVKNGGRELVLFHELNRVSEPQYGICRKSLAYISYALRARYSKGGVQRLHTMFPGPSEGLGPNGFYRYFEHYDLLADKKRPRTFGEVFGKNVDPRIRNKTMLHHGANGVFDSVALCYDSSSFAGSLTSSLSDIGTIRYLEWFKGSVDDKVFLYQSERAGAGKCEIKKGTPQWEEYVAGRGLLPYEHSCSHYFLHTVG
jgi:hypothetical protein